MGLHDTVEKVLALQAEMQAVGEQVEAASRQVEAAAAKVREAEHEMYLQQKYTGELVEHLKRLRRDHFWSHFKVALYAALLASGFVAWAVNAILR